MLRQVKQGPGVYRLQVKIEQVEHSEAWSGDEVFKERLTIWSVTEAWTFLDLVKQMIGERFEDVVGTTREIERLIQFEGGHAHGT